MSGVKQHFIPRMLLRAFRMIPTGKVAQVRVYRADRSYTSPVEDVAAERFFYSDLRHDGGEMLDDVITRYENGLASDLIELNKGNGPTSAQTAARVVTHLLVRNAHVRGIMRAGTAALADLVADLFGSDEKIAALLGASDSIPGPQFHKIFAEHLEKNEILQATGLPPAALIPIAHIVLRENAAANYGEMTDAVNKVVSRFQTHSPLEARDAHAQALSSSLAPKERVENLERFAWNVESVEDAALILPDFVALGWNNDGAPGSLLEHGKDELAVVMMPLSPRRALIGRLDGASANTSAFNEAAIPHCLSFFIGSEINRNLETAAASIARGTEARIRDSIRRSAAEFRVSVTDELAVTPDHPASWASEPLRDITLQTDCVIQEDAARLSAIIGQILSVARLRFDITSLRRIVINVDYEGTLASLDRGRLAAVESPPVVSTVGLSVAYNVNVEQNGINGVAIVLREIVADGLLSHENVTFDWASSVVLTQLAHIGVMTMINNVFADGVVEGDQTDAILFSYSLPGWKAWITAKYAGLFDSDLKNYHRGQFCERLATINDDMIRFRRAYRIHGNVDELIKTAGGALSEFLELACATASHGIDEDAIVEAMLIKYGMTNWFSLLRADLASIWTEGTAYPSQTEMLVLNQHVRRLFVLGAIFFWEDNGVGRVEVPYWSDIDWMRAQQEAQ